MINKNYNRYLNKNKHISDRYYNVILREEEITQLSWFLNEKDEKINSMSSVKKENDELRELIRVFDQSRLTLK
jgi:hypothetical protein